mgnify:CR=1 FL=1
MKPNSRNYCSGRFKDWLEVYLLSECNGSCEWCIDKGGYRPREKVGTSEIARMINGAKEKNVILLGGEPLLYKGLSELIGSIKTKNVYLTTNGSLLTPEKATEELSGLHGINISLHHCDMRRNKLITGRMIDETVLRKAIATLQKQNAKVRFNCNVIKGEIDSEAKVLRYITWAKSMGVQSVRFAEIKHADEKFVSIGQIMQYRWGLNEDPYTEGCNHDTVIDGTEINFRQMCGFQTYRRPVPQDPEGSSHRVLYYDGRFYDGWQTKEKEMKKKGKDGGASLDDILRAIQELGKRVEKREGKEEREGASGSGGGGYCQY